MRAVSIEKEKKLADQLYEDAKIRYLEDPNDQNLFTLSAAMHRLNLIDDKFFNVGFYV